MLTPPIQALNPLPQRRGRVRGVFCFAVSGLIWWLTADCVSQEPPPELGGRQPAAETEDAPASPQAIAPVTNSGRRIQYVGPDTYILLDEGGRPQAMPGMTYEDFMAAWKQARLAGQHDRQARFAVEDVEINGKASGERAELQFAVTVRLLTDEPVDVPLGLVGAILTSQPRFSRAASADAASGAKRDGDGSDADRESDYIDFDPARGGYVAHYDGRSGERRTVTLDLLVPLVRNGVETTLALNCPRAFASKLTLDLEAAVTDASVSSGALLSRESLPGGGTRLGVAGQAGQFRLSWNTADAGATELSTVLSATGAIQVSIDGRSVRTDARLTVRSYGGGFDQFRVRLPRGAKLIEDRASRANQEAGLRIRLDHEANRDDARPAGAAAVGDVVLVELPEKQQGPVTVALSTEQPLEMADEDLAVALSGFEVIGAVRQFGDVALSVADDWQLRWDASPYVRQVDPSEIEPALAGPGLTAAFQYDRQPWSMALRVAARRYRIQVTPEYELDCLPDEARLRVHLTYQILGARAFKFRVDLKGWELAADPLESGGLVDRDRLRLTDDGHLELPLLQPSSRRAEITFFVRRAVALDERRLSLPLPIPEAESIGTGDLLVRSARGIELMPDTAESKGLTPSPVVISSDASDSDDGSEVAEFRFRCFLPDAKFVADRVARARDVAADVAAHVDLGDSQAQVTERVDYTVRFEPVSELVFDVPSEMRLEESAAEVVLLPIESERDGRNERAEAPLMFVSDADGSEAVPNAPTRHVRVSLPQPRLGRFAVEWRYIVNRPKGPALGRTWSIPLAQPADGRLGEMRATVRTPRNFAATLNPAVGSTWKLVEPLEDSSDGQIDGKFVADRPESSLPLEIQSRNRSVPSATIVDRAWLQTWISGNMRQERAAFRFRTTGQMLTIELPPESADEEIEVLLDRQPAEVASREGGRIVVRIAAPEADVAATSDLNSAQSRTLELRYRRTSLDRVLTRRRLTPPQIVGITALAEVYWQIVLPGDRHVVQSPAQLAASSEWQWLGNFMGRRPQRTQRELEAWVGASGQLAPSAAQNEYLFSGLAPISTIEVVTAPRWLVVLAASGGVLALALAWIYLPVTRRRWIVAAVACLLAALAFAYPTAAMLLGQASLLGLALAALAVLIARIGTRQTQWYLPAPGGSTHRQPTPRAESVVMPPLASAVASTAPTAAPERARESER